MAALRLNFFLLTLFAHALLRFKVLTGVVIKISLIFLLPLPTRSYIITCGLFELMKLLNLQQKTLKQTITDNDNQ